MTLVERIRDLCRKTGDTFASLEKKLSFGNGTIRKWSEVAPSGDRLARVADYFHVSVDYLLGRETNPNFEEIDEIYLSLSRRAQQEKLDPFELEVILDATCRMKHKH